MIVGSSRVSGTSRYFAKASALGPLPRYSTQPEESTTYRSEPLSVVTVLILPFHSLGDAAKVFDGSVLTKANTSIEYVNDELLARLELKLFAHTLGDDDLEQIGR